MGIFKTNEKLLKTSSHSTTRRQVYVVHYEIPSFIIHHVQGEAGSLRQ